MNKIRFTGHLRDAVLSGIIKEYNQFLNLSLEFLNLNFENYVRVSFENISIKKHPFRIDSDSCINFMLNSKNDIKNIKLGYKTYGGTQWSGNDILFPFSFRMPELPEWGTQQFFSYREWRDNLEYLCEVEFWKEQKNKEGYKEFSDLNIFNDSIFNEEMLLYYKNRSSFLFNGGSWLNYIASLIGNYFPEFKYNQDFSSKKMKRYLIELYENIWFGFEYDEIEIISELKKGALLLPDYFNLVLIAPSFSKTEDVLNYYYKEHSSVISLGILGNPFFYEPCYRLLGYSAVDSHRCSQLGKPYLRDIIKVNNGQYKIVHPQAYGESMKRHAFFYMDLLASTSRIYLDYLKDVLINTLISLS